MKKIMLYKKQILAIIPLDENTEYGKSMLTELAIKKLLILNESNIIRSLVYYVSQRRGLLVFALSRTADNIFKTFNNKIYINVTV